MRLLFLAYLVLLIQGSSNPPKNFEGVLVYDIANFIDGKLDNTSYGTQVTIYLKDGHLKRVFNSTNEDALREDIYDPATGILYMKIGSSDTIYWSSLNRNPYFNFKGMEVRDAEEKVFDQDCKVLRVENTSGNGENAFDYIFEFYYSDTLRVNPSKFKMWEFSSFSKSISQMKAFYLKYVEETPRTKTIFEITDIQPRNLDIQTFEIDSDAPTKEFVY